jgi:hypothetical protein
LKLIYIGAGNGTPHAQVYRSPGGGDNPFLVLIIAVNAETGEADVIDRATGQLISAEH